jgi:small ligand-binding sensory domain FIST
MKQFPYAHATHPQWRMALSLVLAQLRAQVALGGYCSQPTLGVLYITDHFARHAKGILDLLSSELPEVTDWTGAVGVGVASNNVEYFDEPAISVMLCELPVDQYRVFSGVAPLPAGFEARTALVHADGNTPELPAILHEMAARTTSGYLFGGLLASRSDAVLFAQSGNGNLEGQGLAGGVFSGGMCGVAFGAGIPILSRVTQGCQPVGPARRITACERNLVQTLDGEPALDVLLRDLDVRLEDTQAAMQALRQTMVGLSAGEAGGPGAGSQARAAGGFGDDVRVRHIIGLEPQTRGVAVADYVETGTQLAFCQRNAKAARADLVRICAEIREELDTAELPLTPAMALIEMEAMAQPMPKQIAGAIYVSCSGRGGPHFGGPSAEMQIVRKALGDVPLVGFFAGGEIAHQQLHGYTGVLTVFTDEA